MKPTADNVALILNQFFANVKLVFNGHNIGDGRGGPVTVNKANKGLVIVSCSDRAQFVEIEGPLSDAFPYQYEAYIETLKHYPATRLDQAETVETFYKAYTRAEEAARDLLNFWVDDYWDWALQGLTPDEGSPEESLARYDARVKSEEYPRG